MRGLSVKEDVRFTAELCVKRWNDRLTEQGIIHGVIAHANSLMDIIEEEITRRHLNGATAKAKDKCSKKK